MNLFAKTNFWIGGSLLTIASLFSQNEPCLPSCQPEPCPPPCQDCEPKACAADPITTYCTMGRGCWDLFATASFIYWSPSQDNMELGIVSQTDTLYALHGDEINLDTAYQPGFKLGFGTNLKQGNWDMYLQYTWFRSKQETSESLAAADGKVLLAAELIPLSGHRFLDGKEDWRLYMDLLDLELGKHYSVQTDLFFRPFFGLRAAWIRQNLETDYLNESTGKNQHNISIVQKSNSWALGLRTGLSTDWMVGKCFRVYGNGNGDLLFTQYSNLSTKQQGTTTTGALASNSLYAVKQHNINCVRGRLELELGLGWGTYFSNNNRYVDLSAGYGFQIFFDQNMFRNFLDDTALAKSISPNGNL